MWYSLWTQTNGEHKIYLDICITEKYLMGFQKCLIAEGIRKVAEIKDFAMFLNNLEFFVPYKLLNTSKKSISNQDIEFRPS